MVNKKKIIPLLLILSVVAICVKLDADTKAWVSSNKFAPPPYEEYLTICNFLGDIGIPGVPVYHKPALEEPPPRIHS